MLLLLSLSFEFYFIYLNGHEEKNSKVCRLHELFFIKFLYPFQRLANLVCHYVNDYNICACLMKCGKYRAGNILCGIVSFCDRKQAWLTEVQFHASCHLTTTDYMYCFQVVASLYKVQKSYRQSVPEINQTETIK